MRCLIGTLFDEEQIKEKTKFEDMKAKDDKGHMRWEGAFTGGFTAGYKNTCGSKQGWMPSTFVSSRTKRAERVNQDIHAFMDSEDLGKGQLSQNINLQSGFVTTSGANPFNIMVHDSIGEKILNKLRKAKASQQQPKDQQDVAKLFQKYAQEEELDKGSNQAKAIHFREKGDFVSANGVMFDQEEDPFITEYQDLFNQLIRGNVKQETEEQKKQKKQANRISFDYTKPLDQEDQNDYLDEIVEQPLTDERPNKKAKLELFKHHLDELFVQAQPAKQNQRNIQIPKVPEDYNPYKKMEELAAQQKAAAEAIQPQKRLTAEDRRQALGQHKPDMKSRVENQRFIKGQTQQLGCHAELEFYLMNPQKQKRYQDYVLEMEGKIIGGDHGLDWKEADIQRAEFEKIYKKAQQKGIATKTKLIEIEHNKKLQALPLDKIVRTKSGWRPDRLLCKRFGVLTPYAIEKDDSNYQ